MDRETEERLREDVAELERIIAVQQGQLIALLSLELAWIAASPERRRLTPALCSELEAAQPEPDTPLGEGYAAVIDSLKEAVDLAEEADDNQRRH